MDGILKEDEWRLLGIRGWPSDHLRLVKKQLFDSRGGWLPTGRFCAWPLWWFFQADTIWCSSRQYLDTSCKNAFNSWEVRCGTENGHNLAARLWEHSPQPVSHRCTHVFSLGPGELLRTTVRKQTHVSRLRWFERLQMWIVRCLGCRVWPRLRSFCMDLVRVRWCCRANKRCNLLFSS